MVNETDINEILKEKNKEMLLHKRELDFDKSMESFLMFYTDYCNNYASIIQDTICTINQINLDTPESNTIKKETMNFISMFQNELKKMINEKRVLIKEKISLLDDNDYKKELNYMALNVVNSISDYYLDNIHILTDVVNSNPDTFKKINDYLRNFAYNKLINTLKDNIMIAIKLIDNNYEENNKKMASINEKTLNRV